MDDGPVLRVTCVVVVEMYYDSIQYMSMREDRDRRPARKYDEQRTGMRSQRSDKGGDTTRATGEQLKRCTLGLISSMNVYTSG
jgi:hypothetical protein